MKPILLKIKGLNSFLYEQTIDFSKLTEKGFFGIFGPTGSGKSTILDAITVALYGKVTRDNKGFINTESDRLEVSYEFSVGIGENKKLYVCDRCIKADKSGGYKTTLARICVKLDDENKEILGEGTSSVKDAVEDIIGLSCEDFTRSVVLPQGKFSEFLSLTGLQRRNMLERIFKLEKFGVGLRDKIKKVKDKQEKLLIELNGKLSRYNNISKENIEIIKKELAILEEKEKNLKKEKENIDKLFEEYKILWELKKELDDYSNNYNKLIKDEDRIQESKVKLNYAKNALQIKPFMDSVKDIQDNIKIKEVQLKENNELLIVVHKELENIEKDYEIALKNQREKIPNLIKMSTELKRAIEINKKVQIVKKEKQDLVEEYKSVSLKMKKLTDCFTNIDKERADLIKKLEEIEDKINCKTISPEYRNLLSSAYDRYSKYVELNKNLVLLRDKCNSTKKILENNTIEFEKLKKSKLEKDNLLKGLLQSKDLLHKNCPGNSETLLKAQQYMNAAREKYDEILKYLESKKELYVKYSTILISKKDLENTIKTIEQQYENKKKELNSLKETIEYKTKENIAAMLAQNLKQGTPCPVCGSTHHISITEFVDEGILKELKENEKSIEKDIENLKGTLDSYKIKIAEVNKDEEHNLKELNIINDKLKDLDLIVLEEQKNIKEKNFIDLKEKIEKWNGEVADLEKNLDNLRKEKERVDKLYTSMEEKIINENGNLKNINTDLQSLNDQCEKSFNEYESIIKNLNLNNIKEEVEKIKTWDEELVKLKDIEKSSRIKIEKLNMQREEIQKELSLLESERAKIEQSGKEKKTFIDEYEKEISTIYGHENPEEMLIKVSTDIDNINNLENSLRKTLDIKKNEKDNIEKEKNSLEKNLEMLRTLLSGELENLKAKLQEYGFNNENQVTECLMTKESMNTLETNITKYEETKRNLEDNIKRLQNKIGDKTISQEKWEEIQSKKQEVELSLSTSIELRAQKRKELSDMEKDLNDVHKLLKLKEKYEHKYSLCEELDNVVKGNKFVEFVAMNELKYIAIEASKRLKSITRGRYALEIDGDGNFIMRDDFNGGTRRPTSTLSGGETFLTSLSLALALSSQIQLKGSSPLQFFFLDEGFGSLDSQLLDVVMTSLENLRSEKLCVGIISHVDELKSRVPVKLIVTPASPGSNGTLVNIEYS